MPRLNSILRGTNPEVFAKLLNFYIPPPATIWDCTCGYRHFWENVLTENHTLTQVLAEDMNYKTEPITASLGIEHYFSAQTSESTPQLLADLMPGTYKTYKTAESYNVIYSDKRKIGDVQCSYTKLPVRPRCLDCVVFDPPYVQITLKTKGMETYLKKDRYDTDQPDIAEEYLKEWAITAFESLKPSGYAIVKLQDTVENWHYKMYNARYKFDLEATYIHDLGQNWAENVEVKNARKPIPLHAIWMVFKK
jgi:hypothetical protein